MITVHLDSVYMKVPFKPLMKLTVEAYQQQYHTRTFRHAAASTALNEVFEIRRIGNLVSSRKEDKRLRISAYLIVNGREEACGSAQLPMSEISKGLQLHRLLQCQDKEASVTFTVDVRPEEGNENSAEVSTEDQAYTISGHSSVQTIRILSDSLYKHKKQGCSTHLHKTYSRQLDRIHTRYSNIVQGLQQQLQQQRSHSKKKEYQLKTDHKDTVKLYKRSMKRLESRVQELQQHRTVKVEQQMQTEYLLKEECSIETEATHTCQNSTQMDQITRERIELELQDSWQQLLNIPPMKEVRKRSLVQFVSESFEQLSQRLSKAVQQLQTEKEASRQLKMRLQETQFQYKRDLTVTHHQLEQSLQEREVLMNGYMIERSRQEMAFQSTISSLEKRFKEYKGSIESAQRDKIQELQEMVHEQLEAIEFKIAGGMPVNDAVSNVPLYKKEVAEAQCQCNILQQERNSLMQEALQDNARLSKDLGLAIQQILGFEQEVEQVGKLAAERLTAIEDVTKQHSRLESSLEMLNFEHNELLEAMSKLHQEKELLVRTLTSYEEQGKQLYSFTRNIGKRKESRDNTLDRIERSEKSRFSKKSHITNKKRSPLVKPHPVLLVQGNFVPHINAVSNMTNNSNPSLDHGGLLKVPRHHNGRTSSMQFDELHKEYSPSEAANINIARTEFDQEEESDVDDEEFDLSEDHPQYNSDPILQSELPEEISDGDQDHSPMGLMAKFKESLLAAHREIEEQKDELFKLNAELMELRKKNSKLEEQLPIAQDELAQTRANLQAIIEQLRRDVTALQFEKTLISTQYQEVVMEREALRTEFKSQLESLMVSSSEKEAGLSEEFRVEMQKQVQEKAALESKLSDVTQLFREELEASRGKVQVLEEALQSLREQYDTSEEEHRIRREQYQQQAQKNNLAIEQLQQLLTDQLEELKMSDMAAREFERRLLDLQQISKGQEQVLQQKTLKIIQLTEKVEQLQDMSSESASLQELEEMATQTDTVSQQVMLVPQQIRIRPMSSRDKPQQQQEQRLISVTELQQEYLSLQEDFTDKELLAEQLEQRYVELEAQTSQAIADKDEQLQTSLKSIENYAAQLYSLKQQLEQLRKANKELEEQFNELLIQKNTELQQLVSDFEQSEQLLQEQYQEQLRKLTEDSQQSTSQLQQRYVKANLERLKLNQQLEVSQRELTLLSESHDKLEKQHQQARKRMAILDRIIQGFNTERQTYTQQAEQLYSRTVATLQEEYQRQLEFQLQRLRNRMNESHHNKTTAIQHLTRESPNSSFGQFLERMPVDSILESEKSDSTEEEEVQILSKSRLHLMELTHQVNVLQKELEFSRQEMQAFRSAQLQLKKQFRVKMAALVRDNIKLKTQVDRLQQQQNRKRAQQQLLNSIGDLTQQSD